MTAVPAGIVWYMTKALATGAYQVQLEGKTVSAALAAIPDEESDLRSLSEEVFADRLSGGRQLTYASGSARGEEERQDDLWVWLAAACVGCMLLELMTLKIFKT